jgi:hypothetical protein
MVFSERSETWQIRLPFYNPSAHWTEPFHLGHLGQASNTVTLFYEKLGTFGMKNEVDFFTVHETTGEHDAQLSFPTQKTSH